MSRGKKHNIHITNKDVSIISIVFKTMNKEEVFVEHTDLWISVDSGYAFIEKYVKDDNQVKSYIPN